MDRHRAIRLSKSGVRRLLIPGVEPMKWYSNLIALVPAQMKNGPGQLSGPAFKTGLIRFQGRRVCNLAK